MKISYSSILRMRTRLNNLSGFFDGVCTTIKGQGMDDGMDFNINLPDDTKQEVIQLLQMFEGAEIEQDTVQV